MKKEIKSFKTKASILFILYGIYILILVGLLYATGHKVDFFSYSNIEILSTTILFLSTSVSLIVYTVIPAKSIRFFLIFLLIACSSIIIYNLYLIVSINPDYFEILFPLSFCLLILIRTVNMIYFLFKRTNT